MEYDKIYPKLSKKLFIHCSERIKLIIAESILKLSIFRENKVNNRNFRESKNQSSVSKIFHF